jgi:hypothetical protein
MGDIVRQDAATRRVLDRAAMERVLGRAAELQAGGADPSDGWGMSEQQLVELGREVGLSPEHLRQALAEERTRLAVPEERGVVGDLFGAPVATASRVVLGTPHEVLARIDDWMQRQEALRPKRRFADRATWEARTDFLGSIQVGLNLGGRPYGLSTADEVAATTVEVDATKTLVRFDADFRGARRRRLGWSLGTLGLFALTATIPVAIAATLLPNLVVVAGAAATAWTALGAAIGWGVARGQKGKLARAQLALDQILDRLEQPAAAPVKGPLADLIHSLTEPWGGTSR